MNKRDWKINKTKISFFWNGKQTQQTSGQLTKRKREDPNKQNKKLERNNIQYHRNAKKEKKKKL